VGALTDKFLSARGARIRRLLLRQSSRVVVFASRQREPLVREIGVTPERVAFVPFGVDAEFFKRGIADRDQSWDVVAAGTNEGKDYPTLIRALRPGETCLVVTDAHNAAQIEETETSGSVTIEHDVPILPLKARYAAARSIVIPLHEILYSSGQTILLENLAMGRPVIVSDVEAVRDYVNVEVAQIVPPGDSEAIRAALDLDVPDYVPAAANWVKQHFTAERFAHDLGKICSDIVPAR
jgi:glycosyltransferase involved in cell wall biosynthesis